MLERDTGAFLVYSVSSRAAKDFAPEVLEEAHLRLWPLHVMKDTSSSRIQQKNK